MIRGGQLVLLSFPQTDQAVGRLRPTLNCADYLVPMTTGSSV
jgi:hypothetical protein